MKKIAAKIVIKSGRFWYLWTTKDQNIHLLSSYSVQLGYQLHFFGLAIVRAQSAPPPSYRSVKREPLTRTL